MPCLYMHIHIGQAMETNQNPNIYVGSCGVFTDRDKSSQTLFFMTFSVKIMAPGIVPGLAWDSSQPSPWSFALHFWGGESVKSENGVLHPFMTPSFGEIHWQSWIGMEPFLVLSKLISLISLLFPMDYQSLVVCQVVWSSIEVSTKNLRTCDPKTGLFKKWVKNREVLW